MSLEQQNIISKIKMPNDETVYHIGADWQNIKNKPDLATYAPLASPQLNGNPTAPTAPLGTNTDQIATTAFVQQAIRPTILVTVSDIPPNIDITVSATLIGSDPEYVVTESVNSFGVACLQLDYFGAYSISFNRPQIKGNSTIKVNIPKVYTYEAYWSEIVTYTVLIDKTNSNPETACSYADDALGMVKGSSIWDNMSIFKQIRPCVFQNGQVNYYLNPNNWNKKYASEEDSILTGEDGDVMIEFPKFAYKIKTEDDIITVSISNDDNVIENDQDFTYDAFSRLSEGDLDFFYKGAFKGFIDENGKLRSIAGILPTNNETIDSFRIAAQSNGPHYQQSTYAQLKAIQCLYLIKYGNRNGQSAIGNGIVDANRRYASGLSTLTNGMTFGSTEDNTTHMRLFGIEDFWGNIFEWVDGVSTDENRNIITSWNSFSGEPIETTFISTPSQLKIDGYGYIKDVIGNTNTGFLPSVLTSGSSSIFWTDVGSLYKSCISRFGGCWNNTNYAGPFCLTINGDASTAYASVGGRLSYV